MLRRLLTASLLVAALLGSGAAPAEAAGIPCRPGTGSPTCKVWTGKVVWVADGDTPQIDVVGDGTSTPKSIRLIGVQAMEQSVYSKDPKKRRGECHALAATARVEALVGAAGGRVRLTAQNSASSSLGRPMRSMQVNIRGQWVDVGLDLIRNGFALWLPDSNEWAWNAAYRRAAQLASKSGRRMYDRDACRSGPLQSAKITMTVNYDAPGDDAVNVNGEWFQLHNGGSVAMPVAGWWVRDSGLRRYRLPAGTTIPAYGDVFVHVGKGTNTATRKYWGLTAPVFSNPTSDEKAIGDGGYLFDPHGDLRAWDLYPDVV